MNGYELSRKWFDFCFENPEKITPLHTSIYFMAVEHCNRLGWKEKFGFPTTMVMEAIGVKSYNTYIKGLTDLVNFGFINMIEKSKNQYSANIIALSNFDKALNKALDKALTKHTTKHLRSTSESICSIDKLITSKTIKQLNKETVKEIKNLHNNLSKFLSQDNLPKEIEDDIFFSDILLKDLFNNWIYYRKEIKKPIKAKQTLESLAKKIELNGYEKSKFVINNSIENGWQGLFWDKLPSNQKEKSSAKKEKSINELLNEKLLGNG